MTLYNKITHRIILFLGIKSIKLIPIINNLCNNTLLYFTSGTSRLQVKIICIQQNF